jgi:hypothetical protein
MLSSVSWCIIMFLSANVIFLQFFLPMLGLVGPVAWHWWSEAIRTWKGKRLVSKSVWSEWSLSLYTHLALSIFIALAKPSYPSLRTISLFIFKRAWRFIWGNVLTYRIIRCRYKLHRCFTLDCLGHNSIF